MTEKKIKCRCGCGNKLGIVNSSYFPKELVIGVLPKCIGENDAGFVFGRKELKLLNNLLNKREKEVLDEA